MENTNEYSKHTIFFIKDKKNNSGKISEVYLLYYDEDWDCYLFPNMRGVDLNEEKMKRKLSSTLNIYPEQISHLKSLGFLINERRKFPEELKKWYYHDFVSVYINNYSENETGTIFSRNSIRYTWMSIEEMRNNENIMMKNSDIVEYLENIREEI